MSREEDAYVIERMGKLLAEIAIVVNGPEPPLTRWSYHDLPEKVRALRQAQHPAPPPAGLAAVPEPMPPVPDSMGLSREQREVEDAFRRGWNSCRARVMQLSAAALDERKEASGG